VPSVNSMDLICTHYLAVLLMCIDILRCGKILTGVCTCFWSGKPCNLICIPTCVVIIQELNTFPLCNRYIYIPMVQWFREVDPQNKLNYELKKFIASFTTFGYIFVWHSITYEVFIWTAFNFLGVTIERIGSAIKRKVDSAVVSFFYKLKKASIRIFNDSLLLLLYSIHGRNWIL